MRRYSVLLDANVLVDAQLRDLFLTMAEAELIDLRWSAEIIDETRRALVGRLGLDETKVDRLLDAMGRAFPGAQIEGFEHLTERIELPDHDDRHVLAAATHGECDLLVTFNEDDFPDDVDVPGDVLVVTPDEAIFMLAGLFPDRIALVVRRQVDRLRRPSLTVDEFLTRLAIRAPNSAVALGAALGIEPFERMFHDVVLAQSPDSPHGAVWRLIFAIHDDDLDDLVELVDVEYARELVGPDVPTPSELRQALQARLEDVVVIEEWGLAAAGRLLAPDVEHVKLVHTASVPPIIWEPRLVRAHLFEMKLTEGRWVLVGLDGPDPALDAGPA